MGEDVLPPELWSRIFHYLSNHRADIGRCRLVCKTLHTVGSEFLIPRVVLAKRSDSLQRVWDVLEHPVFRLHVTELVYDASRYLETVATDCSAYARICERFSSRQYLCEGVEERIETFDQLSHRIFPQEDDNNGCDCRGTTEGLDVYSGYIEYSKRWLDQQSTIDKHLHFATLESILTRLPKLRYITFTDFRHAAEPGELYLDLTRRLFGNVVEPNGLGLESKDGAAELLGVLKAIKDTPKAHIRGFSIGGHSYENFDTDTDVPVFDRRYIHLPDAPAALPYNFLNVATSLDDSDADDVAADQDILTALKGLKHLRLPVKIPLDEALMDEFDPDIGLDGSDISFMLRCTASTLVSLELWALEGIFRNDDPKKVMRTTQGFLTALLEELVFDSLRYLELGNWQLPESCIFKDFFSRHSSTLKEVRILACTVYEDPRHMGNWVGQNMFLTGVELDLWPGYCDWNDSDSGESSSAFHDVEETSTDDEHSGHGEVESFENIRDNYEEPEWTALPWQCWENGNLEALWLSGRTNHLLATTKSTEISGFRK